jgi:L-fucose isomerase-like protein
MGYGNEPSSELTLASTQAGGAVSGAIQPRFSGGRRWRHLVQAEVTVTATGAPATPGAGTLSVRGLTPGAITFRELGVIVLTAPDPAVFEGFFEAIEAVSTGLDADTTWTLHIVSGD